MHRLQNRKVKDIKSVRHVAKATEVPEIGKNADEINDDDGKRCGKQPRQADVEMTDDSNRRQQRQQVRIPFEGIKVIEERSSCDEERHLPRQLTREHFVDAAAGGGMEMSENGSPYDGPRIQGTHHRIRLTRLAIKAMTGTVI